LYPIKEKTGSTGSPIDKAADGSTVPAIGQGADGSTRPWVRYEWW
jgi:hypothetical protein